jgi:hypothetical protein
MTDLSPAAQQVFWEFNRAASGKPDDWHYLPSIAAALRAAADQASPKLHIEDIDYQHQSYVDGWNDSLELIRAIAAELDNSP